MGIQGSEVGPCKRGVDALPYLQEPKVVMITEEISRKDKERYRLKVQGLKSGLNV
jgi:hypothetical protein